MNEADALGFQIGVPLNDRNCEQAQERANDIQEVIRLFHAFNGW